MAATSTPVITEINQSQSSTTLNSLTLQEANQIGVFDNKQLDWLNKLRNFLFHNVLPIVEPDPNVRLIYVSLTAMKVWKSAFTDSSYDPNLGENYEVLEKLGDAVMKQNFIWMVMNKYPSIQEGQLSRFSDTYLAKSFQAALAVQLGITEYIRSLIDISRHTKEDTLESLFGGLYLIGNVLIPKADFTAGSRVRKISMASDACQRLVEHIFANVDLDINVLKGSPINQVKEIFDKMRWKSTGNIGQEIEINRELNNGRYRVELHFNPPFYDWIAEQNALLRSQGMADKQMNFDPTKSMFGVGEGDDKKEARQKAYYSGISTLESLGFTWEWADDVSRSHPGWDDELKRLFDEAEAKAKREGYAIIDFSKLRKGTAAYFIQLYGYRLMEDSSGKPYYHIDILTTIDASAELPSTTKSRMKITDDDLKRAALTFYLKYGTQREAVTYRTVFPY